MYSKLLKLFDLADRVRLDNDVTISKGKDSIWVSGFRLVQILPDGRMLIHFQGEVTEASPQVMEEEIMELKSRIKLRNRQIRDLRRQLRR